MAQFRWKRMLPIAGSMICAAVLVAALVDTARTADPAPKENAEGATHPPLTGAQLEEEMSRRNGAIFVGWTAPKLALVFTGLQNGYIEPCGCSGKENQKGGLSRRDMLLHRLAAEKWPLVALDLGGQVRRFGKQQELKFQATADALKTLGYQAVGFSPDDLRLSAGELLSSVAAVGNQASTFVCANVGLYAFDEKILPRYRIIDAGGMKIGVTSVIGDKYRAEVNNQDLQFQPAEMALKEVLPKLEAAKCNYLVLLSNATKDESIALAKKFPQFNVVMTAGGADEPPADSEAIAGTKGRLIELGPKGMYAIVLGLYSDQPNAKDAVRYQRVPLDARFGESPRMKQALASYQDQLKELGFSDLGIKPMAHPTGRTFVGSQTCGECHSKAFAVWKKTPHATALLTLTKLDPPRQFDAECLSCHVTGWEPQKFAPYAGGYVSIEKTPQLAGNGCENCHGPGSQHVAAENAGTNMAEMAKYRKEMHLSINTEAEKRKVVDICLNCHDPDNSIEFKGGEAFDKYWAQVAHHGKD
ncbi:MAG TPA: multiheme c-type cytochrome [Pirellulales bacterium]|jgi:hypothetical protein